MVLVLCISRLCSWDSGHSVRTNAQQDTLWGGDGDTDRFPSLMPKETDTERLAEKRPSP